MFRALRILYRLYKLRWLIEESELVRYERVHIPDKKAFYSVYCRYLFTENGVYPLYDSSAELASSRIGFIRSVKDGGSSDTSLSASWHIFVRLASRKSS